MYENVPSYSFSTLLIKGVKFNHLKLQFGGLMGSAKANGRETKSGIGNDIFVNSVNI
jgi:hypothetical protein